MLNHTGPDHIAAGSVEPGASSRRKSSFGKMAVFVLVLSFFLCVVVQWKTGAWYDDFSATGDEASHFTTAVATSRYLTSHLILHPYQFASNYYLHYPKLGFGKWPPVFYVLSGVWFSVVAPSRLTALLFIALQIGVLGLVAFWVASKLMQPGLAPLAAITIVMTPFFAMHSTIFMIEPTIAALGLLSLLSFLGLLQHGGWKLGALFVVSASACIFTKANGWALLPAASIGYLALRKRAVVRPLTVAAALLSVVALCSPFYYIFLRAMSDGNAESGPTFQFVRAAVPKYLAESFEAMGCAVSLLLDLHILLCILGRFRQSERHPLIVLSMSWITGVFLFQLLVPASFEVRHLSIAFPGVVLLSFVGLEAVMRRYGPRTVVASGIAVLLLTIPWLMPSRFCDLFQTSTLRVVADLSRSTNKAVLICSNGPGEGRMVASMAALDPDAHFVCIRASKLLADTDWGAQDYRLLVRTKEEVLKKLDSLPVGYIAIHEMVHRQGLPHYALLQQALSSESDRWHVVAVFRSSSGPEGKETLTVFENPAALQRPITHFEIDMRRKLGNKSGAIFQLRSPAD